MTPRELSERLTVYVEDICRLLLPHGKRVGSDWCAGSVAGGEGSSLKVKLQGAKVGLWCDFANPSNKGDLITLFEHCRGVQLREAILWAKDYLGVTDADRDFTAPATSRKLQPPPKASECSPAAVAWFAARGLGAKTIAAYRVVSVGQVVNFVYWHGNDVRMIKFRDITTPKKQAFSVTPGAIPALFGWPAVPESAREVVITEGECLLGTTEVLTPGGWISLADYASGPIAQWSEGNAITWVEPRAKVSIPFNGGLCCFSNSFLKMTVTPGHRMVGLTQRNEIKIHTAAERMGGRYRHHRLPRSGILNGGGTGLTEDRLAFCLAVSADAAIDVRKQTRRQAAQNRYARFSFKRQRKIDRMDGLLSKLALPHKRTGTKTGHVFFGVPLPEWVPGRYLPWSWIANATKQERNFLVEELKCWDGNAVKGRTQYEFATKHIDLANWAQALSHTAGRCSTIMRRKNHLGAWFKVSILNTKQHGSYQSLKTTRPTYSGRVYCVTVDSGMFLARENGHVFVTGNCDAMAYYEQGIPALSVPMGGGGGNKQQWMDTEYDNLEQFDTVYLSLDMDEEGRTAAEAIAARLGLHRVRIVDLPKKDANECLTAGLKLADYIRTAKHLDPKELRSAKSYAADVEAVFTDESPAAMGVPLPWDKTTHNFRLRRSEVTIWAGFNGHGKTTALSHVMCGCIKHQERVLIASMEVAPVITLKRMYQQVGAVPIPSKDYMACISDFLDGFLWLVAIHGTAKAARLIEIARYAWRRYGITQFVVDSLSKCGYAEDDYNSQKGFVDTLGDLAHETGMHVHLVCHSRKGENEWATPGKMDVKGTGAITDMVDNVVMVWRNKPKEDQLTKLIDAKETDQDKLDAARGKPDAMLTINKQRNYDWEGRIGLWFDVETHQYMQRPDFRPTAYAKMERP